MGPRQVVGSGLHGLRRDKINMFSMLKNNVKEATIFDTKSWRLLLSFAIGSFLGVFTSFTVNCSLVEISINPLFAVYFGVLFFLIAAVLYWRVETGTHPQPKLLASFAALIALSGFICLILDTSLIMSMSNLVKIPLYTILGASVCFALLFSIIDIMNYFSGMCCDSDDNQAIIQSENQVYLVVGTSLVMGGLFGFIFGWLDVEDASFYHLRVALMREESVCYPIGAVVGGLGAAANQWLRESQQKEYKFDPIRDDDLDEQFNL